MIAQETMQSAIKWCDIGARWIENGAVRLGLNYLDRAISVFSENDDQSWVTFASHHKLSGLAQSGREDQAIAMFDEVMHGYNLLGDDYGKGLLLSHLAECLFHQGRNERAMAHLNLAFSIAKSANEVGLQAHIMSLQAMLTARRNNLLLAIRHYREAESLLEGEGEEDSALYLRFLATKEMTRLGELSDAVALLEDTQSRLMTKREYRKAVEPLSLLSRLYEEMEMWEEKNRVSQLVYLCGQSITKDETMRRLPGEGRPRIRRVAPPEPVRQEKPELTGKVPGLPGPNHPRKTALRQKEK